MTTITFVIPKGADHDEVYRKVNGWANRKSFGISWSIDRRNFTIDVDFWPEKSTPEGIKKAAKGLERILKRCAPTPVQPVPPPKTAADHIRKAIAELNPRR